MLCVILCEHLLIILKEFKFSLTEEQTLQHICDFLLHLILALDTSNNSLMKSA